MPTKAVTTLTMRTVRNRPGVKLLVLKKPVVSVESVEEVSVVPDKQQTTASSSNNRTASEALSPLIKPTITKDRLQYLKQQTTAIVRIQTILRGTLARWNLPVLKLQHKLDSIRLRKTKQLYQLERRINTRKQDIRMEMEHTHEHRRLMRRIQKAEFLKTHFQKLVDQELATQTELQQSCQQVKRETMEMRQGMFQNMQASGKVRMDIARLGQKQSKLKKQIKGFKTAVELFQEAIAATTAGEP